jgi:hypothetical protein
MDGVKHFSEFFQNKKELPKFDKKELLNDFFLEEDLNTESESEDTGRRTAISNFPHIAKEESDKRDQRIEKSYKEDPDGMYPRDDQRYDDSSDSQGGWQDGMGAPPSNESNLIDRDEVEQLIQREIQRIKNQNVEENRVNESQEITLPEQEEQEEYEEEQIVESNTEYYKVYADKSETFSCEIELEGANLKDTEVRLVLESDNWNLMFPGEIDRNGKVTIPIRKLNIFEEGTKGKIKMEVIAEGTVFTPWEDDFEVKMSKKVMVKFNESKSTTKPKTFTKPGVKVNFKK